MELDPKKVLIKKVADGLIAVIDGEEHPVARVARAFPKTRPKRFVGLMDQGGHEIGLIQDIEGLDDASRELLEEELRRLYYVPRILEVQSIRVQGTSSEWQVTTAEGEVTFQIADRSALDGKDAPAITITDDEGKRYRIPSFWALDDGSRRMMRDLIPDKVRRSGRGRVARRTRRRED